MMMMLMMVMQASVGADGRTVNSRVTVDVRQLVDGCRRRRRRCLEETTKSSGDDEALERCDGDVENDEQRNCGEYRAPDERQALTCGTNMI